MSQDAAFHRSLYCTASMWGVQVWSRTSALHCSSTSAGVEQPGCQISVSKHGVELLQISVLELAVTSNFSRAKWQRWGQIWPKRWKICNLQILVNYTKYYTAAIFTRKSLIYMYFWRAWISAVWDFLCYGKWTDWAETCRCHYLSFLTTHRLSETAF